MDKIPSAESLHQICNYHRDESNDVWCIIWETFGNASMTYDLAPSSSFLSSSSPPYSPYFSSSPFSVWWWLWNSTKLHSYNENHTTFEIPVKFGLILGFLIFVLFTESRIIPYKIADNRVESTIKSLTFLTLNIFCFIIIAPFIALTLLTFFIYRKIIDLILKLSCGKMYGGLLEGTDCVWAIEDNESLSVINVLGILEMKNDENYSAFNCETNLKSCKKTESILADVKTLVQNRLLSPNFDKLSWTRSKKYGYYYWTKQTIDSINLDARVRWLNNNHNENDCNDTCCNIYGGYLKQSITNACNQPLPQQHSAGWEILIGNVCHKCKQYDEEIDENNFMNLNCKYINVPILFRIHHTLGDGVALLRLLLEGLADKTDIKYAPVVLKKNDEINLQNHNDNKIDSIKDNKNKENSDIFAENMSKNISTLNIPKLKRQTVSFEDDSNFNSVNSSEIIYYSPDILSASMPFSHIQNIVNCKLLKYLKVFKSTYLDKNLSQLKNLTFCEIKAFTQCVLVYTLRILKSVKGCVEKFIKSIVALVLVPSFLVRQAIRSMDNSAIHGPALTGNKIISCWMEDDFKDNDSLLEKIRDIKNITNARFGDVVLAALSANLHKYFHQINKEAPNTITVVIPVRMTAPSQRLMLKNGFSVGLLPLCVGEINGIKYNCSKKEVNDDNVDPWRIFDRIHDASESSEKLRTDPDYLINYWVMNFLAAALPEFCLKPLLHSRSTMVFSNLPGPKAVSILGSTLKKVTFWIPHRGTTGIGCAFLTYSGNVHFSIVADKAVISNEIYLDQILQGTINDIKKLHENIKLRHCQKSKL